MDEAAQKIKVFEINTSFAYAGAQRTMFSFCKYLRKDYFQIFAISYGEGGSRQKDFESLGIPTLVAGGDLEKIFALAEKEQPAVIHIHRSGGSNQLERELLQKLRVMFPQAAIVETNVFGQYDSVTGSVIDMHLLKSKMMLMERFVPAAGGVFDPRHMHVVYNPVDHALFEQFRISKEEVQAFRTSLGIPRNHVVIGRLGRPDITKWSDLLFEMMPVLLQHLPNITCLIQDLPPSRRDWLLRAPWKEHVRVISETTNEAEVHRFYQSIDILVHTSKIGEAFGNTLNEAMYWQKPIVTHSTPKRDNGQVEQVDHAVNGFLANTPEDMAAAVLFLGTHPEICKTFGKAGHAKVTDVYDPSKVTAQLEKVFLETLTQKGNPQANIRKQEYQTLQWSPSVEELRSYKKEYPLRSETSYHDSVIPQLSSLKKMKRAISRFLWKIHDIALTRNIPGFRKGGIARFLVRVLS